MLSGGPETPQWADQLCSLWGQDFRVVWASRHLSLMGGYWESDGAFAYRWRPRYPSKKCYVLERWLHGRHYGSPNSWTEATISADGYLSIGPYPVHGIWECCCLFDRTPLRADTLSDALRAIHAGRIRSVSDIRRGIEDGVRAEEAELDREFEELWDASHSVRRGLSFTHEGILQNTSSEIEAYKSRLAAAKHRVRSKDFQSGFFQGELGTGPAF